MHLLERLYKIHSPSKGEMVLSTFIQNYLTHKGVEFNIDHLGQIYSLNNHNSPLISAHLDQVQTVPCEEVQKVAGGSVWRSKTGLGADDKNGIWICLQLIDLFPDINFLFTTQEEIGSMGLKSLLLSTDIQESLEEIPYALIFDRRGAGDIIGKQNGYCTGEFEEDVSEIGKEYGFYPCFGVYSDCDVLNEYMSCVNLSCGFFEAHSKEEYTVIPILKNTLEFAVDILNTLEERYEIPEPIFVPPYRFTKTFGSDTGYDDVWDDVWNEESLFCPSCGELIPEDAIMWIEEGDSMECSFCFSIIQIEDITDDYPKM